VTTKKPTTKKPVVCDKICSADTYGKPCMDDYMDDDMCWDYDSNGNCPMDTTDCSAYKDDD